MKDNFYIKSYISSNIQVYIEFPTVAVLVTLISKLGFPGGAVVKNPPSNAGDERDADFFWAATPGGKSHPQIGNTQIHRLGEGKRPQKKLEKASGELCMKGVGFSLPLLHKNILKQIPDFISHHP